MMLRFLVVLLLLGNVLVWSWSRDALRGAPAEVSAPQARQVRPEALVVRPLAEVTARVAAKSEAAAAASAPAQETRAPAPLRADADQERSASDAEPDPAVPPPLPEPPEQQEPPEHVVQEDAPEPDRAPAADEPAADDDDGGETAPPAMTPEVAKQATAVQAVCWQAGPFNAAQAQRLREAAAGLSAGSWQLQQSGGQASRWMVYLGGMEDELAVLARRSELRAQGLDVDRAGPGFELGLSLGRYSSREAADRALQMLSAEAGVSDARVVQERTDEATYFLRAESARPDWRSQLQALPLAGHSLRRCS